MKKISKRMFVLLIITFIIGMAILANAQYQKGIIGDWSLKSKFLPKLLPLKKGKPIFASTLTSVYTNDFNPAEWDRSHDVAYDALTNTFIAVGIDVIDTPTPNGEWRIEKYNPDGSTVWSVASNPSPNPDVANGVAVDSFGNIIVVGNQDVEAAWRIEKRNASGTLLWELTEDFTAGYNDSATSVAIDSKDNIIVVGGDTVPSPNDSRWRIHKYSPEGILLWSVVTNPSTRLDNLTDVAIDSQDNIIAVGQTNDPPDPSPYTSNPVWYIQKYTPNGILMWSLNRDHGPGQDVANAVAIDHGDKIIVTGSYYNVSASGFGWKIEKYSPSGAVLYSVFGPLGGEPNEITLDEHGNVYVAGYVGVGPTIFGLAFRIEIRNPAGILLESITSNPTLYSDVAYGIDFLPPNGFVVVGHDEPTFGDLRWRVEIYSTD